MVIKGKETRRNTSESGAFASHRFMIELDDSESERDDSGTCSVEDLIPTMHNLKIRPPQQSRNDNQDMTKTRRKTIEIVLRNDETHRFEVDDRTKHLQVESSPKHSLLDTLTLASKPAILDEAIDVSKPTAYGVSESSAVAAQVSGSRIIELRPRSDEGSLEGEKVTRNKSDAVTSVAASTQYASREPPREPRAMREQRNREQQRIAALEGQQLKVEEGGPKHLRLKAKENNSRFRSGR